MASILTDILDDKTRLSAEIFEREGYKHYKEIQLFEKEIYNYLEHIPTDGCNLHTFTHTFGVRKAYLMARVHFWDDLKKVRIDCTMKYITLAQERRYIKCGSIKTVKDLFDLEVWAYATIERINIDYKNGTYNWPDYEYHEYKDIPENLIY